MSKFPRFVREIRRVWVNQPSTLQPFHKYNGQLGLAEFIAGEDYVSFFPIRGNIHSMILPRYVVVNGWPKCLQSKQIHA